MLRELRQRLRSEMRRDRIILQLRAKLVAYLLINSVDNFLTRKHGRKPYRGLHGCKPANSGSACHAVVYFSLWKLRVISRNSWFCCCQRDFSVSRKRSGLEMIAVIHSGMKKTTFVPSSVALNSS